jgi:hypothetical protein
MDVHILNKRSILPVLSFLDYGMVIALQMIIAEDRIPEPESRFAQEF